MPHVALRAASSAYRALRRARNALINRFDPPVIVLGYHRVAAKEPDPKLVAVSPANFRAQMKHLRRTCRVVPLEGDWSRLGERAAAVTFDDGYADNLLHALPILKEFDIPATFFLTTSGLDGTLAQPGGGYWWDELERLVLGDGPHPSRFQLRRDHAVAVWSTATVADRWALYRALHPLLLGNPRQREGWLAQLREWRGSQAGGDGSARTLTAAEARALTSSPLVTIGAHTATHPRLSALSQREQEEEIGGSKRRLEALLGVPVTSFAYPFGSRRDYDRTSIRLCREAGFLRAVSTEAGQVHRWTDRWQMPRQLVRNWDAGTFAAHLEGFWTS